MSHARQIPRRRCLFDEMKPWSMILCACRWCSIPLFLLPTCFSISLKAQQVASVGPRGYYRFPAIHGDTIVFTTEGDLWKVGIQGGAARRLTTHPGEESHATISPDGQTLAFSAQYETPTEVYTMPLDGGLPTRRTFEGYAQAVGWTPDGKLIYSTPRHSTLPSEQLVTLDLKSGEAALLPLSQASSGVFEPSGKTLFFTP